jgi:general stress protein 26
MTDLEKRIWRIIRQPQTAALATIGADGAPWVRYVTVRAEADFTMSFCTARSTRKARQIEKNPNVHLTCGMLQPPDDSVYLQIAARAEIRADAATKIKYWQDGWRRYFKSPDDAEYVMVFIHPQRIEYNGPGSFVPEIWEKK